MIDLITIVLLYRAIVSALERVACMQVSNIKKQFFQLPTSWARLAVEIFPRHELEKGPRAVSIGNDSKQQRIISKECLQLFHLSSLPRKDLRWRFGEKAVDSIHYVCVSPSYWKSQCREPFCGIPDPFSLKNPNYLKLTVPFDLLHPLGLFFPFLPTSAAPGRRVADFSMLGINLLNHVAKWKGWQWKNYET